MDDFKENIPLISALFNPGLRERHWVKMSEIAEQDLTPTEVKMGMEDIRRRKYGGVTQGIVEYTCTCMTFAHERRFSPALYFRAATFEGTSR